MEFITDLFTTSEDKVLFLKGLFLMEITNGKVTEQETTMIQHTASILGIDKAEMHKLFPDPLALDLYKDSSTIKFANRKQAIFFLQEAIRLGKTAGHYSLNETAMIAKIALLNNIEPDALVKLDNAVEKVTDAVADLQSTFEQLTK